MQEGTPAFVSWPQFPVEGDFRLKAVASFDAPEPARLGEPDGGQCPACGRADADYLWCDDDWRVFADPSPAGLPAVVAIESRRHLDLEELPEELAASLGVLTVRVVRAMQALPDVARAHIYRWGEGGAHCHLWCMARPVGAEQLRGHFLPAWQQMLPRLSNATWAANLQALARELATR